MSGNNRPWREPTPEEKIDEKRRRRVGQLAAQLSYELSGCVAGSDEHIAAMKKVMVFAREVSALANLAHQEKRRLRPDDSPQHIGDVIAAVMGELVLMQWNDKEPGR